MPYVEPPPLLHIEALQRAAATPSSTACIFENEPDLTFQAAMEEAARLAFCVSRMGLRAGDTISFILPNWREAVAINLAASMLGLVINPIVPIYRDAECLHILRDAGTKLIFVPGAWRSFDYVAMIRRLRPQLPALEHLIIVRGVVDGEESYQSLLSAEGAPGASFPEVDPDSVKLRLYTSGTTGPAKAVLHSHRTLAASRGVGAAYCGYSAQDVIFMPSPVTHITGYTMALEMPFFIGAKAAFMLRWNAAEAVDYIARVSGSVTVGATPFLQELLAELQHTGRTLPSLRMFACGGAAVPPDLIRLGHRLLPTCRFARMYGSTEAPAITRGWMGPQEQKLAAVTDGRIVGWEVVIRDSAGHACNIGEDGEILAKGPGLFLGYGDASQTAESFTPDGYFKTGDIGHITSEGGLSITGRSKDIIIRGGENLSAKEIEDVLHRHAGVIEAAVVSMPHDRLGETACAFIVPTHKATPPTLQDLVGFVAKAGLAPQKYPQALEIIEEFPRTPSGKIRKDILRTMIRQKLAQSDSASTETSP